MPLIGSDELFSGYHHDYPNIILSENTTYSIVVQSQHPGVLFDVEVYDENGNLVQTTASGSVIGCTVTPVWRGTFTIRVKCVRGTSPYSVSITP